MTLADRLEAALHRLRRWRAWTSYGALRLGRAGLLGLALAVVAAALALAGRGAAQEADAATAAADALRATLRRDGAAPRPAPDAGSLLAALPPEAQVAGFVEDLHGGAARVGVGVERAEYRTPTLAGGRVLRTQVVLPVVGAYPAVGAWLAALLREHPSTALDELSLQRDAEAGRVRARIVLSHYSRADR